MSDYRWLTNLRAPFDLGDSGFLTRLSDYRVGAPQVAEDRPTAYTIEYLNDINVVGIYTTAHALAKTGPEALTVAKAKERLGADFQELDSQLTRYLDADFHFQPH